ncbi:MAG: zinc ribbon domain-containing protein [Bacteroidota bacterium]
MDTVLLLVIVLASVGFVALPYLQKRLSARGAAESRHGHLADLYAQRDNLLSAIKDVELDHEMGKISEEDYTQMNTQFRREAVAVFQKIDDSNGKSSARRRLEEQLQTLRKQPNASNKHFCPICGLRIKSQARFCSNCGHQLSG